MAQPPPATECMLTICLSAGGTPPHGALATSAHCTGHLHELIAVHSDPTERRLPRELAGVVRVSFVGYHQMQIANPSAKEGVTLQCASA